MFKKKTSKYKRGHSGFGIPKPEWPLLYFEVFFLNITCHFRFLRGGQGKKVGPRAEKRMSSVTLNPPRPRKAKANIVALLYVAIDRLQHLTTETIRKPTASDVLILSQSIYNDNKVRFLSPLCSCPLYCLPVA